MALFSKSCVFLVGERHPLLNIATSWPRLLLPYRDRNPSHSVVDAWWAKLAKRPQAHQIFGYGTPRRRSAGAPCGFGPTAGGLGTTSAVFCSSAGILTTCLPTGTRATRKPTRPSQRAGPRRNAAVQDTGSVLQQPPRGTRLDAPFAVFSTSSHHSQTLPCMSYKPSRFGWYEPTLHVRFSRLSKFACSGNNWFVGLS